MKQSKFKQEKDSGSLATSSRFTEDGHSVDPIRFASTGSVDLRTFTERMTEKLKKTEDGFVVSDEVEAFVISENNYKALYNQQLEEFDVDPKSYRGLRMFGLRVVGSAQLNDEEIFVTLKL